MTVYRLDIEQSRPRRARYLQPLAAMLLAIGIAGTIASFVGVLVGPRYLMLLGVYGFFIGWLSIVAHLTHVDNHLFGNDWVGLAADWPWLDRLAHPRPVFAWVIAISGLVLMLVTALAWSSTIINLLTSLPGLTILGGPAGLDPLLTPHKVYLFSAHGRITGRVSRAHYLWVGISFQAAWHSATFFLTAVPLYHVLYRGTR